MSFPSLKISCSKSDKSSAWTRPKCLSGIVISLDLGITPRIGTFVFETSLTTKASCLLLDILFRIIPPIVMSCLNELKPVIKAATD